MDPNSPYDCIIVGNGIAAGLTAGLLAERHHKRVMLISESWSAFRLRREIAVAATFATRPETLQLLSRLRDETQGIVTSLGKGLIERPDQMFIAETPDSAAALLHFRHIAQAFGFAVEPAVDRRVEGGTLVRLRGAPLLVHGRIEPAIAAWLERLSVPRVDPASVTLAHKRDNTTVVSSGRESFVTPQILLADEAAVLAFTSPAIQTRLFTRIDAAAVLVEGASGGISPVSHYIDRGLTIAQSERGAASVLAKGNPLTLHARIGATLGAERAVRSVGEVHFQTLATGDGAPFVGQLRGGVMGVVGLGAAAPFYAPMLARMMAGDATELEAAWCAARSSGGKGRDAVADVMETAP